MSAHPTPADAVPGTREVARAILGCDVRTSGRIAYCSTHYDTDVICLDEELRITPLLTAYARQAAAHLNTPEEAR